MLIFGVLEDFENSRCAYLSQVCTGEVHSGYLQGAFEVLQCRFSAPWRTLKIPGVLTCPQEYTGEVHSGCLQIAFEGPRGSIFGTLEDVENSRCAYLARCAQVKFAADTSRELLKCPGVDIRRFGGR